MQSTQVAFNMNGVWRFSFTMFYELSNMTSSFQMLVVFLNTFSLRFTRNYIAKFHAKLAKNKPFINALDGSDNRRVKACKDLHLVDELSVKFDKNITKL